MAQLQELVIKAPPGVVKTDSLRAIEGRWSDTTNIRFVHGLPQKIGGNVKAYASGTDGTPRTLHAWRDRKFNGYMAVGTFKKLYVYDQGLLINDITPYRATGTLGANPLTTSVGTPIITVTHVAHGLSINDIAYITGATAVGGITPNMPNGVPVASIIDADHYTYLFTANATSTATGGGAAVAYKYEVPVGVELGTYGYGWGVGAWGLGTWGTARSLSTLYIEPRVWSLDHFGILLLATYNGGTLYQFDPTQVQPWPRAILASSDPGMPTNMRAMFITPERFVMALCDGMQVAWPSQGTIDQWTPTLTNTANIRTLTEGTKLVAGRVLTDFVSLIWTDAALYRFQYTGATYIYASSMVGKDCGLIGPNACITVSGVAYWMGQDNFWTYNGVVAPMPNVEDIRKWLFDQIDINLGYQFNAQYVPKNNEVWFFVTPVGSTNPTFGVIYSIDQQCWAPLYFGRTGGSHYTQGDTKPYMGAADFNIYQHENGNDDNGAVLPYSMTLAPYAMTKGGASSFLVEYIVNDFKDQIGDITQTTMAYDRLDGSPTIDSSMDVIPATNGEPVDVRVSGRYIGLTLSCSSLGSYVRLGLPVAFIRKLGERS